MEISMTSSTIKTDTIKEFVSQLCESLETNYRDYHVRSMKTFTSDYAKKQLEDVNNGTANLMKFKIVSGKKYYKIIQQDYDTFQDRNEYRDGSVHAFVDKNTGEVYKPASWKSPAKHVRFNLNRPEDRAYLFQPNNVDWAGGYLYMR
jgi:hypothetical protein|tara:strand:- start:88 stop:528 length:441 start_codon:yes stop_codon:yes gene_type:complete